MPPTVLFAGARAMLQKLGCLAKNFAKSESGATAIEYGLIAADISVAIIAMVNGVGTQLNNTFTRVKTSLSSQ
jgi:pilus assembly protein Flp/PilA